MPLVNFLDATKKEIHSFYNTLVGSVKGFEDFYTCVDLTDECYVTGKIVLVDGFMNLEMEDVLLYNRRGDQKYFKSLFIKGRNIRCVHTPETAEKSAIDMLKDQLGLMAKVKKKDTKKTFKIKRAQIRNAETIASAYSEKE